MTSLAELYRQLAPSIANIVVLKAGERVASGTGFLVAGHLVTCAHVLRVPPDCTLEVRFEQPISDQSAVWKYPQFGGQLPIKGFSDEHSFDYALLAPPQNVKLGPSLSFSENRPSPGQSVCTLGYPFEDPHLTLHQGIVSAAYSSGVATMIKLDMSVNPSNSGGPLIDLNDGKVVGVVARKATGLSKAFDDLQASYDANITALKSAKGIMSLGSVDPVEALIAGQYQMKAVAAEIARSANVGIGYAIWPDPLRNETALAT